MKSNTPATSPASGLGLEFFRLLPVPVINVDSSGRVLEWNDQAEALSGWTREEVSGRTLSSLLQAPDRPRWRAVLRLLRMRADGRPVLRDGQLDICTRRGQLLKVSVAASASLTEQGLLISIVARDITASAQAANAALALQQQWQALADGIPSLIGYVDADERIRFANAAYERAFLRPIDQIVGKTLRELMGPRYYAEVAPTVARTLQGQTQHFERLARQRDGTERHFVMDYRPDIAADGTVRGYFTLATDITARKIAEQKLVASERGMRMLMDNVPVLVSYHDQHTRAVICNARHRDWLGLDPDDLIGKKIAYTLDLSGATESAPYFNRALLGEEVAFEAELVRDGVVRVLQTTVLPDRQADGSVVGFFSLTVDRTAQKQLELQLAELARVDSLTGLPNRRQLEESLKKAIERSRRSDSSMALMFVDIDRFKLINDTHGHAGGDEVLQTVARRLQEQVRSTDTVARLGGDEFIVLLENLHAHDVGAIAEKLLAGVAQPISLPGGQVHVTISLGLAMAHGMDAEAAVLMSEADEALYDAKRGGRNALRWARGTARK